MVNLLLSVLFSLVSYGQVNQGKFDELVSHAAAKNFVINPSCLLNKNDIVASNPSNLTRITSNTLVKGGTCRIDASANGETFKWRVSSFDLRLKGQNCEAKFTYLGDASLYVAYVEIGTNKVTADLSLPNSSNPRVASINFPCGDLTQPVFLVIQSTSASAQAVDVANVYVGEATNIGTVTQGEWLGKVTFPQAASCGWSTSSATWATMPANSNCNLGVASGQVQAPSTKQFGVRHRWVAGQKYWIKIGGMFYAHINSKCAFRLSDGSQHTEGRFSVENVAIQPQLILLFEPTITVESTLLLQAAMEVSGFCGLDNITGYPDTRGPAFVEVFRLPTSSEQAVRMDQAGWFVDVTFNNMSSGASGVFIIENGAGSITNKGTAQARVTCSDLSTPTGNTCATGNEQAGIEFDVPTPGIYEVCASLTLAGQGNGSGGHLNTKIAYTQNQSNTIIEESEVFDFGYTDSFYGIWPHFRCNTFNFSSSGKKTIKIFANVSGAYSIRNTTANRITVRQSTQQAPAPLLVGGVTSSSQTTERIERARVGGSSIDAICSSSPCTLYSSSGGISSVTRSSTGQYVVNFASGAFKEIPVCVVTPHAVAVEWVGGSQVYACSVSSCNVEFTKNTVNAYQDANFNIICMGPR